MSREWEIDCEVKNLVARIVLGTGAAADMAKLQHLSAERVRRMARNFGGTKNG